MANGCDTSGFFKPAQQQQPQSQQQQQQQQQYLAKERNQESNHLLMLQKEIKEEEEQIFADIDSFINSSSNGLYLACNDDRLEQDDHSGLCNDRPCDQDYDDESISSREKEQAKAADKLFCLKFNPSRLNQFNLTDTNQHHHHHNHNHHNHHNLTNSSNITGTSNNNSNSHNNLNNTNINLGSRSNTENTNPYHVEAPKTSECYRSQRRHQQRRELANDSDDLNEYQSHSADDTTINEYHSDSLLVRGSAGARHSNNTTDESHHQHDSSFRIGADFMIPASREAAESTHLLLDDSSQYIQDELLEGEEEEAEEKRYQADGLHSSGSSETGEPKSNRTNLQFPAADCLEEKQQQQLDYQAIQAVIQQVQSNLPKPCVFFLEGNCRRSDCKYSHDLSNIICKYWIEGFCFKGELCPFQHSYSLPNDSSLPDAKGIGSVDASQPQLNPTFAIESEADFPSLPLDAPPLNGSSDSDGKRSIKTNSLSSELEHQILSSNSAVLFKTVKKKRKRG